MHLLNNYPHIALLHARLTRAIPFIPIALALFWLLTIYRGERSAFSSTISACDWSTWETWAPGAQPHQAILIADPQLVDPHTYPGRPWPLSSLTERYTDRYMARSYRLINEHHDPDSIIFLGDMLDGGREWAPSSARALNNVQKWQLEKASPATTNLPEGAVRVELTHPGWQRPGGSALQRREVEAPDRSSLIDLTAFVPGEGGRWRRYGNKQWESEYKRFGNIFLAPQQLYPIWDRQALPCETIRQSAANVENGARDRDIKHYAVVGSKTREVLASLPGNHDLGFGSGVQMPIRGRYKWHFGDLNRVDVLGNHTFVSIDALSLAAWSQFEASGRETAGLEADRRKHIYAGTQGFIDALENVTTRAVRQAMSHSTSQGAKFSTHTDLQEHIVQDAGGALNDSILYERDLSTSGSTAPRSLPVILLTHVPLYREPDTSCGPLREKGNAIRVAGGYQYQNVLTRTLSEILAVKISAAGKLVHVFSGDDHDYCDITHSYAIESSDPSQKARSKVSQVREETVKSFSWAMGVRRPAFHMVSLWNPYGSNGEQSKQQSNTIQTHLCLLPDQLGIFLHYITIAGLTVLVLLTRAVVLALGPLAADDSDDSDGAALPMLQGLLPAKLRRIKGSILPSKTPSKHRHRASSSGLKPMSNGHLGVQRSANARARSVSPGVGLLQSSTSAFSTPTKPMAEQVGYYDADASEDEESRIGDMDYLEFDDGQAKLRRRSRPQGRLRTALDEFVVGMGIVVGVAAPFYIVLISRG